VLEPAPGFTVLEATDAWLRGRKLARDAVVGRPALEFFADEMEAAAIRASLARVIATRAADERHTPVLAPGGRIRYVIHRDAAEVDVLRNALDREEAMRELRAAKEELQAFAYSASHDLRAPLRLINAYCARLRSIEPGGLLPVASELLHGIERNVQNLVGILDGMLTLSNVDTMKMRLERVDLTALARRILRDLGAHEPERHVELSVAEGLAVNADRNLLAIALENLLGNAWKYTREKGRAKIELGSRQVVGREVFYVRDNGAGFDMSHAERLFRPFVRLHSASEFEGHGIGLATVRRVVERHGGQIWAESKVGEGTTISFTLR
jgi:light-regulated signal transduction histidine kinase (bacteriophytochrome)